MVPRPRRQHHRPQSGLVLSGSSEGKHQCKGMIGRALEPIALVKGLRFIRDGVYQQTPNSHNLGSLGSSKHGILQQCRADSFALPASVYGQPAEDSHGNRIWHVPADFSRSIGQIERPRREAVIANDAPMLGDDIGARRPAHLVGPGAPTQPIIQLVVSALEEIEIMRVIQWRRRRERQDCQGLGAFIRRAKPSPPGGLSRIAR